MNGNELTQKSVNHKKYFQTILFGQGVKRLLFCVAVTFSGFFLTKSIIFGRFAPFPIALAAAVPSKQLLYVIIGSIFGYVVSGSVAVPARYIAAIIAVLIIRLTLREFKLVNQSNLFAPIVSLFAAFSTGLTVVCVSNTMRGAAALYAAEALLCAASSYFFDQIFSYWDESKQKSFHLESVLTSPLLLYSFLFFILCLLLSLKNIIILDLSVMRILFGVVILLFSRFGNTGAGAVAGIAVSVVQSLSTVGLSVLSGVYAAGGFFAGLFQKTGNLMMSLIYILSVGIFSLQSASGELSASAVMEALIASIIFWFAAPRIERIWNQAVKTNSPAVQIKQKLSDMALAIRNVPSQLEQFASVFAEKKTDQKNIFIQAVDDICKTCQMRDLCWGIRYNKNFDNLLRLSEILEQNQVITEKDIQQLFSNSCFYEKEFAECVNHYYHSQTIKAQAEKRAKELRTLLAEQFVTVSDILEESALSLDKPQEEEASPPLYTLSVGLSQHICGESAFSSNHNPCGDDFTWFENSSGKIVAILSDGMGTGRNAAIDSTLCTGTIRELLRSGLSPRLAIKIAGHAILSNARDESFATADISVFDPVEGIFSVYKAGGCPTIFLRNGEVIMEDLRSLPIGILGDVHVQSDRVRLKEGDLAVMLTDGALAIDTEILCGAVESFRELPPKDLAEKLIQTILDKRKDGHDDDISIAVLAVERKS